MARVVLVLLTLGIAFANSGDSCSPNLCPTINLSLLLVPHPGANLRIAADFGDFFAPDPDRVVIFNSTGEFCSVDDYDSGYPCDVLEVLVGNQGGYTMLVDCRDEGTLQLENGMAALVFHMIDIGPTPGMPGCDVVNEIQWMQTRESL